MAEWSTPPAVVWANYAIIGFMNKQLSLSQNNSAFLSGVISWRNSQFHTRQTNVSCVLSKIKPIKLHHGDNPCDKSKLNLCNIDSLQAARVHQQPMNNPPWGALAHWHIWWRVSCLNVSPLSTSCRISFHSGENWMSPSEPSHPSHSTDTQILL